MQDKRDWNKYWSKRTDGGHRNKDESSLHQEYLEQCRVLGSGLDSLLDFGCGSAELLSYYSANAKHCYGCDFSESMLARAEQRLGERKIDNVKLIRADLENVWEQIPGHIDVITCCGVIQYFNESMISSFLDQSLERSGKVVLFDVIDQRYQYLWRTGFYGLVPRNFLRVALLLVRAVYVDIKSLLIHDSLREMGNAFHPDLFYEYADRKKITCSILQSRYYPYRYHVVLTR